MKIVGTDGLSSEQIHTAVQQGARFVIYQYCVSVLVMTFRRPSSIYFLKPGESAVGKGLGFSAMTLVLGWWGIPWGPIYTVQSLWKNFGGGIDVTRDVLAQSAGAQASAMPQAQR